MPQELILLPFFCFVFLFFCFIFLFFCFIFFYYCNVCINPDNSSGSDATDNSSDEFSSDDDAIGLYPHKVCKET